MNRSSDTQHLLVGLSALLAIPALLLLDAAVALGRGWQAHSRLDQGILVLAAAALLSSAVTASLAKGRAMIRRRRRELLLLLAAVSASWAVAEAVLAAFVKPKSPEQLLLHSRWPNLQRVFRPQPSVMPGVEGVSHYSTNSRGIRGPELPVDRDVYRILCLGGSTTECLFLDDKETWPHLLMERLNRAGTDRKVWVGNLGIAGYSTAQHLRFVQQSELIASLDAIVVLAGVNDLTGYLMRSSGQRTAGADRATSARSAPLWSFSAILSAARVAWHRWARSYEVEDPEGANYLLRRRARRRAPQSNTLPAGLEEHLSEYATRIRAIAAACRAKGAEPIFATHPVLWDESLSQASQALLWMGAVGNGQFLSAGKLREAMDRYNATLKAVCEELGAGCIDLSSLHGRTDLFYDDCHLNEAGAREVADLVFQWFEEHGAHKDRN